MASKKTVAKKKSPRTSPRVAREKQQETAEPKTEDRTMFHGTFDEIEQLVDRVRAERAARALTGNAGVTTLDNVKLALDKIDESLVWLLARENLANLEHVRAIALSTSMIRGMMAADGWGQSEVAP
jgi:hypothetical protein